MNIELFRISSCDLPHHPAYVVGNLDHTRKVCELLNTSDTVWSRKQLDELGARAANGEFDMHDRISSVVLVVPDSDLYECANCGNVAERDDLPAAKFLGSRLTPGDTYTDVECSICGALCFPAFATRNNQPHKK